MIDKSTMVKVDQAFAPLKKGTIRITIKNEKGETVCFEQDFKSAKVAVHRKHNIPIVMLLGGF